MIEAIFELLIAVQEKTGRAPNRLIVGPEIFNAIITREQAASVSRLYTWKSQRPYREIQMRVSFGDLLVELDPNLGVEMKFLQQ